MLELELSFCWDFQLSIFTFLSLRNFAKKGQSDADASLQNFYGKSSEEEKLGILLYIKELVSTYPKFLYD